MKPISATETYVLRDGEEYEVTLAVTAAGELVVEDNMLAAGVRCLNTGRKSLLRYYQDGSYLPEGKPHALDLIKAFDWNTGVRDQARQLLQLNQVYRTSTDTDLLFTVRELGPKLHDIVTVHMTRESTGQSIGTGHYLCDGSCRVGPDEMFSLIPAFPTCSTWAAGDPLFVHEGRRWVRAVYVSYDSERKTVTCSRHSAPGMWLSSAPEALRYCAESVAIPSPESIKVYTSDWSENQIANLLERIRLMRISWPYPEPESLT